jgi:hypothetical protein
MLEAVMTKSDEEEVWCEHSQKLVDFKDCEASYNVAYEGKENTVSGLVPWIRL